MVEKIDWSARARGELFEILEYWSNRNKSKIYSENLNNLFLTDAERLAEAPEIGKRTRFSNVRMIIVRDYFLYYKIHSSYIEIITIWDSRRDPKKFRL